MDFLIELEKYLILSCFGFKMLKMRCLDVNLGRGPGGQVSSGQYLMDRCYKR